MPMHSLCRRLRHFHLLRSAAESQPQVFRLQRNHPPSDIPQFFPKKRVSTCQCDKPQRIQRNQRISSEFLRKVLVEGAGAGTLCIFAEPVSGVRNDQKRRTIFSKNPSGPYGRASSLYGGEVTSPPAVSRRGLDCHRQ